MTISTKSAALVSLCASFLVVFFFFRPRQKVVPVKLNPKFHPEEHEPSWDPVDEASWESFPASDPPATW